MLIIVLFLLFGAYLVGGNTVYTMIAEDVTMEVEEAESFQKFRRKIIFHYMEYAYNIGKIREAVVFQQVEDLVKKEADPSFEVRFPYSAESHTMELFGTLFDEKYELGAEIFAAYVIGMQDTWGKNDDDIDDNTSNNIWDPQV